MAKLERVSSSRKGLMKVKPRNCRTFGPVHSSTQPSPRFSPLAHTLFPALTMKQLGALAAVHSQAELECKQPMSARPPPLHYCLPRLKQPQPRAVHSLGSVAGLLGLGWLGWGCVGLLSLAGNFSGWVGLIALLARLLD